MSCCGGKRQAWREEVVKTVPKSAPVTLEDPTVLYHLGETSFVIRGPESGHTYLFAGRGTELAVDKRDVEYLISTRRFSLEWNDAEPM